MAMMGRRHGEVGVGHAVGHWRWGPTRAASVAEPRAHARPHMLNSPRFSRPVTASFALNRDKAEYRRIFVALTSLLHTFVPPS